MLRLITWGVFIKLVIILAVLYYGIVAALFYRKEIMRFLKEGKWQAK